MAKTCQVQLDKLSEHLSLVSVTFYSVSKIIVPTEVVGRYQIDQKL